MDLQKFDKKLYLEKSISWSIMVMRKSMFNKDFDHEILSIKNKYIWSWRWLLAKLSLIDNTRRNVIKDIMDSNKKLFWSDKSNISRDVAWLFTETSINI